MPGFSIFIGLHRRRLIDLCEAQAERAEVVFDRAQLFLQSGELFFLLVDLRLKMRKHAFAVLAERRATLLDGFDNIQPRRRRVLIDRRLSLNDRLSDVPFEPIEVDRRGSVSSRDDVHGWFSVSYKSTSNARA